MVRLNDTEIPNFADDIRKIRILSFQSNKKSLLYAGYELCNNWKLAADFAKVHGMYPIQATDGGKHLSTPARDAELNYTPREYRRVWDRASVKYCLNIEGSVKTFVCGSNQHSTFRRKEIHALLRSTSVDEINGRPHAEYVRLRHDILARLNEEQILPQSERHKRAINRVFRTMAMAEIRQDLAIAREQNNEPQAQSVLARTFHVKAQHREELRHMPRTAAQQKISETMQAAEEMSYANPNLHIPLFIPHHAHG